MSETDLLPGYRIDPSTGAWVTLPWPGDPTLPLTHPQRLAKLPPSLGPHIINWAHHWLVHHQTGEPWQFTPGQKRFIHMWYAFDPETGRKLYRSGIKRGAKGTGKDPAAAVLALIEMCGPVELAGWTDEGWPVGKPRRLAKVQLAANSINQAKEGRTVANRTMSAKLRNKLGLETGKERPPTAGGPPTEGITASESSAEGSPVTAVILNETHHMTPSSGRYEIAKVGRRNAAKSPKAIGARVLEFTNAHRMGEGSVAEESYDSWQDQVAGISPKKDILYDSVEYDPSLDLVDEQQLRRGLEQAYQDAPWIDIDNIVSEAQDKRTAPSETIRFYLNGLAAAEEAWIDPAAFDALARPETIVEPDEKIAMFLDCSKSSDATTLSACRLSDGHVMSLGGWRRPHGARGDDWIAPRDVVDAVVREAFDTYKVVWFGVDPSPATDDQTEALYWRPMIDDWHRDFQRKLRIWATPGAGGHSVLFDMRMSQPGAVNRNRLFTEAAMQTALDINDEKTLTHDGDPMLRAHAHNARRRPNQWGVGLGKANRSSNKLVDYAVTMVGARMGRQIALRSTKVNTTKTRGARLLN